MSLTLSMTQQPISFTTFQHLTSMLLTLNRKQLLRTKKSLSLGPIYKLISGSTGLKRCHQESILRGMLLVIFTLNLAFGFSDEIIFSKALVDDR